MATTKTPVIGEPVAELVSTSYVERSNLSMRMGMRRFTRLKNAFSKKFENHCAAIALYLAHYNFVRQHRTLRVTPAVAAGVETRIAGTLARTEAGWSRSENPALTNRDRFRPWCAVTTTTDREI